MSGLQRQSSSEQRKYGDNCDDAVDPRVQVELERLNTATDLINKLEVELDDARANFRQLLNESSHRLKQMAKKLGSCLEKARPYYNARMQAKKLQAETQKAALRFERASSSHMAAKEMVRLAEEGLQKEGRTFDPVWQEMLNHATMRVNEAEQERVISEREHMQTSQAYNEAEQLVTQLHQELKRAIVKSSLSARRSLLQLNNLANQHQLQLLPYFEMKAQFNEMLEEQKLKIHHLEEDVLKVKMSYADALRNLEEISDEIHQRRQLKEMEEVLGTRGPGVGAESPVLSSKTNNEQLKCKREVQGQAHMNSDAMINQLSSSPSDSEESYLQLPARLNSSIALGGGSVTSSMHEMSTTSSMLSSNSTVLSNHAASLSSSEALEHNGHQHVDLSNGAMLLLPRDDKPAGIDHQQQVREKVTAGNGSIVSKFENVPLTDTPLGDNISNADSLQKNKSSSSSSKVFPNPAMDDALTDACGLSDLCISENYNVENPKTNNDHSASSSRSNSIGNATLKDVAAVPVTEDIIAKERILMQQSSVSSTSTPLSSLEYPSFVLRTSKEDISDNESMASTDTADTLDDHQIECLMLDKVLEHDFRSMLFTSGQLPTTLTNSSQQNSTLKANP